MVGWWCSVLVGWMARIERKAISVSARREATDFCITLCLIVAIRAQTLQCAEPERLVIAAMWLDVVCCIGCLSDTLIGTRLAPWFDCQLMACTFAPSLPAIP